MHLVIANGHALGHGAHAAVDGDLSAHHIVPDAVQCSQQGLVACLHVCVCGTAVEVTCCDSVSHGLGFLTKRHVILIVVIARRIAVLARLFIRNGVSDLCGAAHGDKGVRQVEILLVACGPVQVHGAHDVGRIKSKWIQTCRPVHTEQIVQIVAGFHAHGQEGRLASGLVMPAGSGHEMAEVVQFVMLLVLPSILFIQHDVRGQVAIRRLYPGNHVDHLVHQAIQFLVPRNLVHIHHGFQPLVEIAVVPERAVPLALLQAGGNAEIAPVARRVLVVVLEHPGDGHILDQIELVLPESTCQFDVLHGYFLQHAVVAGCTSSDLACCAEG